MGGNRPKCSRVRDTARIRLSCFLCCQLYHHPAWGSPIAGSFLAYLAASIVVAPSVIINPENRREFFSKNIDSMILAIACGLASGLAQLLRYLALGYTSAILVSLLNRTFPLWVLIFSFLFIRRYESFSRWVLIGNGLLGMGTLLVLIS